MSPTRKNARQPRAVSWRPRNARMPDEDAAQRVHRCDDAERLAAMLARELLHDDRDRDRPFGAEEDLRAELRDGQPPQAGGQRREGGCRGVADDRDQQQAPAPDPVRLPGQEERGTPPEAVIPRIQPGVGLASPQVAQDEASTKRGRSCRSPRRRWPRTAGPAACAGSGRRDRSLRGVFRKLAGGRHLLLEPHAEPLLQILDVGVGARLPVGQQRRVRTRSRAVGGAAVSAR